MNKEVIKYKKEYSKALHNLILLSSIRANRLLEIIANQFEIVKGLVGWEAVYFYVQLPDGIWSERMLGYTEGINKSDIEKLLDGNVKNNIDYIAFDDRTEAVLMRARYDKEVILKCIIVLKEKLKTSTKRLMPSIYKDISIISIEGYKLLRNSIKIIQRNQLTKFSSILNSTLEPKVIQRQAMEAIVNVVNSEVGSLLLIDEKTGDLKFEVALGDKENQIKEITLKKGEGIAGWVAENDEAVLINDCSSDPRFASNIDKKVGFSTRNMICVPVKIKDKVIGVLQAINKRNNGKFSNDDLKLLSSLSEQIAIALENASLFDELQRLFIDSAQALAEAIEKRDPYTGGHIWRVVNYSLAIGKYLNLDKQTMFVLKLSAILHDIGKIGIDDHILRKPAPLDYNEFEIIKQHPLLGAEIIKRIEKLGTILPGVLYHHERYDGKGYPFKLKGKNIPLIAKIIAVADTFDAICSSRPYRRGLTAKKGRQEIIRCSGTQFDPDVVKAFARAFDDGDIAAIIEKKSTSLNAL